VGKGISAVERLFICPGLLYRTAYRFGT
jgi:hypothetical protein